MTARLRIWLLLLAALALLYAGGLLVFMDMVARQQEPGREARSDGIVVLTGGSARLATAIRLLHEGRAERMLISGAGPGVTRASIGQAMQQALGDPDPARQIDMTQLMDCCVDVGFEAGDTAGNAVEAAAWAAGKNFQSLRLVTANYHLPRALVEFRRRMPEITILPHPVRPDFLRVENWWRQRSAGLFLVGEYTKYIAALVRARIEDSIEGLFRPEEAG